MMSDPKFWALAPAPAAEACPEKIDATLIKQAQVNRIAAFNPWVRGYLVGILIFDLQADCISRHLKR